MQLYAELGEYQSNIRTKTGNRILIKSAKTKKIPSNEPIVLSSDPDTKTLVVYDPNKGRESRYVEALDYYYIRDYSRAKDILVEIINMDKNYSNAWYLLGDILNKQGDKKGAKNFLKKALSINPSHTDAKDLYEELNRK